MTDVEVKSPELDKFEEPIVRTLDLVTDLSGHKLQFDHDGARRLQSRTNRLAAISNSPVRDPSGTIVGRLITTVLAPQQGNGQSGLYERIAAHPNGVDLDGFPPAIRDTRLLPRTIDASAFEIFVPISSHKVTGYEPLAQPVSTAVENAEENPHMYAASLKVLGVREGYSDSQEHHGFVAKVGTVGLPASEYEAIVRGRGNAAPAFTKLVGRDKQTGEPQGEPYALLNTYMDSVQVFALMCISKTAGGLAQGIIDDLPTQGVLPITAK